MTSESSRAGIARALLVGGIFFTVANLVRSQTNASIPQDRRARARHRRRWLCLTLGGVPTWCRWPPRPESRVRASSWARAPSSPRHTAALVDATLRTVCRPSPCCGKPYRTAPPTRPTPSLRPRSPPSSTPPEVCLETMEFDFRIRHGTTTTHAPHSSPKVPWGHDEHAQPGRAFLALAPSRAAALTW